MKKVIVFDMDGVIVDSIGISYELILDNYPNMTKEEFLELQTGNYHEEIGKHKLSYPVKEMTAEEKEERKKYYAMRKLESPIFAGMTDLLKSLHDSGYLLILNSSAYERNCIPILEKAGIATVFDMIATAEVSKSKVEKFKIIQENYTVSAEHILFITDSLGDVLEAKTMGVPTIAVTWGAHEDAFFRRQEHANLVRVVETVNDLKIAIDEFFVVV